MEAPGKVVGGIGVRPRKRPATVGVLVTSFDRRRVLVVVGADDGDGDGEGAWSDVVLGPRPLEGFAGGDRNTPSSVAAALAAARTSLGQRLARELLPSGAVTAALECVDVRGHSCYVLPVAAHRLEALPPVLEADGGQTPVRARVVSVGELQQQRRGKEGASREPCMTLGARLGPVLDRSVSLLPSFSGANSRRATAADTDAGDDTFSQMTTAALCAALSAEISRRSQA
jgi:hypothetical protein